MLLFLSFFGKRHHARRIVNGTVSYKIMSLRTILLITYCLYAETSGNSCHSTVRDATSSITWAFWVVRCFDVMQ